DDDALTTVVMLDAAYGDVDRFRAWIAGAHDRRLIDVGDDSQLAADELHRSLPETLTLDGFPIKAGVFPQAAHGARILYIRSSVGHMRLVTGAIALPMILREVGTEILPDAP